MQARMPLASGQCRQRLALAVNSADPAYAGRRALAGRALFLSPSGQPIPRRRVVSADAWPRWFVRAYGVATYCAAMRSHYGSVEAVVGLPVHFAIYGGCRH